MILKMKDNGVGNDAWVWLDGIQRLRKFRCLYSSHANQAFIVKYPTDKSPAGECSNIVQGQDGDGYGFEYDSEDPITCDGIWLDEKMLFQGEASDQRVASTPQSNSPIMATLLGVEYVSGKAEFHVCETGFILNDEGKTVERI